MTLILNLSIVKCHINLHFYILNTKYCCHANLRMNHICTAFCFIKYKYIINTLNFQELHFSIQFTPNSCINHFPFSHTSTQKPELIKANVKKITAFAVKFVNWPTNIGNEKEKWKTAGRCTHYDNVSQPQRPKECDNRKMAYKKRECSCFGWK